MDFDVVIIGGGINGAGIAHEAASRGLRTCLLEQGDLCSGTSRWSSRLIHGGLRYLEYGELRLVRESLAEREHLLKNAAHLVRPLPLLIPLYKGARRGQLAIKAGLTLYDLLSMGKSVPNHRMLGVDDALEIAPGLNTRGLRGAASYHDAQVTFAERLVVENALAARSHGASIRTRCGVERLLTRDGRIEGVEYHDHDKGLRLRITARTVVNAGGPWVDHVLDGLGEPLRDFMGGTKGTHIVVPKFPGAPTMACYVEARSDGRPFFVIPWDQRFLIGTTDIRYEGDPAEARADDEEIEYLVSETNRVFPRAGLTRARIQYAYTGVRPLPNQDGRSTSAITRSHTVRHHRAVARGLYSVIGGKLTTYRSLAEEVTDRLIRHMSIVALPSMTDRTRLPGGQGSAEEVLAELSARHWLSAPAAQHLVSVYGSRALRVVAMVEAEPSLGDSICAHSHALAAEVVFALEQEMAGSIGDVLMRRTMSGLGPDLGLGALEAALGVAARHLGWDEARLALERESYQGEIARFTCS